jgi:hypothetical protein
MDRKKLIAKIVNEQMDEAVTYSPTSFAYAMSEVEYHLDSLLRLRPTKSFSE